MRDETYRVFLAFYFSTNFLLLNEYLWLRWLAFFLFSLTHSLELAENKRTLHFIFLIYFWGFLAKIQNKAETLTALLCAKKAWEACGRWKKKITSKSQISCWRFFSFFHILPCETHLKICDFMRLADGWFGLFRRESIEFFLGHFRQHLDFSHFRAFASINNYYLPALDMSSRCFELN